MMSIVETTKTNHYLRVLVALAMMVAMLIAARPAHAETTTYTVTNTNDSGPGSLRQAIFDANHEPGAGVINFAIPGSGVHTITPEGGLPTIADRVTIDGYSQGSSTADTSDDARPNTATVGTNAVLKIELDGSNASGNNGLLIESGGSGSVIKGLVINRFSVDGIRSFLGTQNRIEGNFIGTDPSGQVDLGNGTSGVNVVGSTFNTVGGSTPAARNLISGNNGPGVILTFFSLDGDNNRVEGNLIGTKKDGTSDLGNSSAGVGIDSSPNNTVSGNTIAFNGADGVSITEKLDSTSGDSNILGGNSIFSNEDLGIDLANDGVTANDSLDTDSGPNELQNFPVITSAKTTKKGTTITGTLNSTPNKTFTLQFFSNPSGGDEGQKFLGQLGVTTGASGDASFSFKPAQKVSRGQFITATARDSSSSNTSEFSAAKKVVRPR